jgi:hypothetical protein
MGAMTRTSLAPALLAMAASWAGPAAAAEPAPIFNGKDLTGWVNVYGTPDTWAVREGVLVCTARSPGFLRTERMYQNYRLELEWRLAGPGANSGVFLHSDALPQVGAPFPRSLEAQIYGDDHGSLFGIRDFKVVPITNPGKGHSAEARPLEQRCRPAGAWNRYALTSSDGAVDLEVNGKLVTRVKECSQRKGYIALQAEKGEVHFRNLRVTPLPGSEPPAGQVAGADESLRPIFDGATFAGWKYRDEFADHWVVHDGVLMGTGKPYAKRPMDRDIWTEKGYGDFQMIVDWRLPKAPEPRKLPVFTPDGLYARGQDNEYLEQVIPDAGDSGVFVRGSAKSQVNIWSQPMGSGGINDYHKDESLLAAIRRACMPSKKADGKSGEWNRFVITMRGDRITVVLNGETVIDRAELPGVPLRGPIGLRDHNDPIEFRNLFLRPLE